MLPPWRSTSKLKSKVGINLLQVEGVAEMSQVKDAVASFGNASDAEEDLSSLTARWECDAAHNTEIGWEEERNWMMSRL
jgi:hypothetical protein